MTVLSTRRLIYVTQFDVVRQMAPRVSFEIPKNLKLNFKSDIHNLYTLHMILHLRINNIILMLYFH